MQSFAIAIAQHRCLVIEIVTGLRKASGVYGDVMRMQDGSLSSRVVDLIHKRCRAASNRTGLRAKRRLSKVHHSFSTRFPQPICGKAYGRGNALHFSPEVAVRNSDLAGCRKERQAYDPPNQHEIRAPNLARSVP